MKHQNLQLLFAPSTWILNVGVKAGFHQCNGTRFRRKVHQMFTNFSAKKQRLQAISSQAPPHQDRASDAQVDASNSQSSHISRSIHRQYISRDISNTPSQYTLQSPKLVPFSIISHQVARPCSNSIELMGMMTVFWEPNCWAISCRPRFPASLT